MFGPVIILAALTSRGLMPASKFACAMLEVSLCSGTLLVSLPLAIAAFPQKSTISHNKLEKEFSNRFDDSGKKIEKFYFNKGL